MTFSRSIWSWPTTNRANYMRTFSTHFRLGPGHARVLGRPQTPKFSNGVGIDLSMWSNIRGGSFSHVTKSQTSSITKIYRPEPF